LPAVRDFAVVTFTSLASRYGSAVRICTVGVRGWRNPCTHGAVCSALWCTLVRRQPSADYPDFFYMRDDALTVPWGRLCHLGNACRKTTLSVCLRLRQTVRASLEEATISTTTRSRTGLVYLRDPLCRPYADPCADPLCADFLYGFKAARRAARAAASARSPSLTLALPLRRRQRRSAGAKA